jgi:hypothetical protein
LAKPPKATTSSGVNGSLRRAAFLQESTAKNFKMRFAQGRKYLPPAALFLKKEGQKLFKMALHAGLN